MAGHVEAAEEVDEEQAERIFRRELQYLENGLNAIPDSVSTRIAMLHYPPFDERLQPNEFAEVLSRYSVDVLVYGHVHLGTGNWLEGVVDGVRYLMVSADVVDFVPQSVLP
jgi:predicted phosphohydrolase